MVLRMNGGCEDKQTMVIVSSEVSRMNQDSFSYQIFHAIVKLDTHILGTNAHAGRKNVK